MGPKRGRVRPAWLLSMVVVLVAGTLFTLAMRQTLANNSSRDDVADLGAAGPVTVRFSTDPNPATAREPVRLSFVPLDVRRRPLAIDSLTYEFGQVGFDEPAGADRATAMSDGSGMWMGQGHFASSGAWWVRATLSVDGRQATVEYPVRVEDTK